MAWTCVRCEKKIYEPREGSIRFALEWKYKKTSSDLTIDIKRLDKIKEKSVITHIRCDNPEVEGFKDRMREKLRMPKNKDHPLLS